MRRSLIPLVAVLAGAVMGSSCGPPAPTSLVPGDYRTRFTRVRDCRPTNEHIAPIRDSGTPPISNIAVYVNPESAAAYMANANPLPPNTLVVKEESRDPDCATVLAWSVMRKESDGYDPTRGNWRYQRVLAQGNRVEVDGVVLGCAGQNGCHTAPECVARDYMCTMGP